MDTLRPTEFLDTGVFTLKEQNKFVIKTRPPQLKTIDDLNQNIITPNVRKQKMILVNPRKLITLKNKKK